MGKYFIAAESRLNSVRLEVEAGGDAEALVSAFKKARVLRKYATDWVKFTLENGGGRVVPGLDSLLRESDDRELGK